MKKAALQKPIAEICRRNGFEKSKGNDYTRMDAAEELRFVLRIPDGRKGFIFGAQFPDFGESDGLLSHCMLRQYDFAYELAYGDTKEYTPEEIQKAAEIVLDFYRPYWEQGLFYLRENSKDWTFGDLNDALRNQILLRLGLSPIDPYSEEYQRETAEKLRERGEQIITLEEYLSHQDFYDRYRDLDAEIRVEEKRGKVIIDFHQPRWFSR